MAVDTLACLFPQQHLLLSAGDRQLYWPRLMWDCAGGSTSVCAYTRNNSPLFFPLFFLPFSPAPPLPPPSLLSKGACCLKEHSTDFTNKIEFTCHKEYYNSGKSSTKCEKKILMLSLGLTGSLCDTEFETYGGLPVRRGLTKGTIEKKEKKGVRISLLPLL